MTSTPYKALAVSLAGGKEEWIKARFLEAFKTLDEAIHQLRMASAHADVELEFLSLLVGFGQDLKVEVETYVDLSITLNDVEINLIKEAKTISAVKSLRDRYPSLALKDACGIIKGWLVANGTWSQYPGDGPGAFGIAHWTPNS